MRIHHVSDYFLQPKIYCDETIETNLRRRRHRIEMQTFDIDSAHARMNIKRMDFEI